MADDDRGSLIAHDAFCNPVNGGWDGYRGECRDCDWFGPVHSSRSEGKQAAKRDAAWHMYGTADLAAEAPKEKATP